MSKLTMWLNMNHVGMLQTCIIADTSVVEIDIYEQKQITEQGCTRYRCIKTGKVRTRCRIEISVQGLEQLVRKAIKNKSQKSVDGPITISVLKNTVEIIKDDKS